MVNSPPSAAWCQIPHPHRGSKVKFLTLRYVTFYYFLQVILSQIPYSREREGVKCPWYRLGCGVRGCWGYKLISTLPRALYSWRTLSMKIDQCWFQSHWLLIDFQYIDLPLTDFDLHWFWSIGKFINCIRQVVLHLSLPGKGFVTKHVPVNRSIILIAGVGGPFRMGPAWCWRQSGMSQRTLALCSAAICVFWLPEVIDAVLWGPQVETRIPKNFVTSAKGMECLLLVHKGILLIIIKWKIGTQWVQVSTAVTKAGWMLVDGSRIRQPDLVDFVGQLSGSCMATNVS